MNTPDLASLPFQWLASVRHRKAFHPDGIVVAGTLTRVAEPGRGLPLTSGPVVARFSKALGVPGALPDVGGLAWRAPAAEGDVPWDLLTVTVAEGRLGRVLLRPVTTWNDAVFSTLLPFRHEGRLWWLRARITTPVTDPGLGLDLVERRVGHGGIDVDVEQALGMDEFRMLARMRLDEVRPADDVSFDPVVNEPSGVQLAPHWLTSLRRAAYRRSREGRDAQRLR